MKWICLRATIRILDNTRAGTTVDGGGRRLRLNTATNVDIVPKTSLQLGHGGNRGLHIWNYNIMATITQENSKKEDGGE